MTQRRAQAGRPQAGAGQSGRNGGTPAQSAGPVCRPRLDPGHGGSGDATLRAGDGIRVVTEEPLFQRERFARELRLRA